ncbi:hypothetical protein M1293_00680 [Candidatus Parvarchaeota archaeon]|nr:hypothetical protein [Candidatus Parvarchaeota archaeon]
MDALTIYIIDESILWAHLFSAILFIGGSFFMWIVLVPSLKQMEEPQRTLMMGRISKRFAKLTGILLFILVSTGLYNAMIYLSGRFYIPSSRFLLVVLMASATVILITLLYGPGRYFGKKIVRLAKEGKLQELNNTRKKSRIVSIVNLSLMVFISVVAVLM